MKLEIGKIYRWWLGSGFTRYGKVLGFDGEEIAKCTKDLLEELAATKLRAETLACQKESVLAELANSHEVAEALRKMVRNGDAQLAEWKAAFDLDANRKELERIGEFRLTQIHKLLSDIDDYQKQLSAVTAELQAWKETADQMACNRNYYRGLVVKCGEHFGVAAKTQDDGGIVEDVLCAKVPELVAAVTADRNAARAALEKITQLLRRDGHGSTASDGYCVCCDVLNRIEALKGGKA